MFYGEHLSADEVPMKCACGIAAIVEVVDTHGVSQGWFCRSHAHQIRRALRRRPKLETAIVVRRKSL